MILRLLTLSLAFCFAGAAEAAIAWSAPGSSCVPAHTTTKFDRHRTGIASVRHAGRNVDPIFLVCEIFGLRIGATTWNLRLVYTDSTGTDTTAIVRARLFTMAPDNPTPVLLAQASSNSSASTEANTVGSREFTHMFNFQTNIYWVRVALDRSSSTENVTFHAVFLEADDGPMPIPPPAPSETEG